MNEPGWKWFWRAVAAVATVFMIVAIPLFWTAWRSSPFVAVANGQEVQSGIDVIAIQLDILSLVVAVTAIGLGVAGFVGYQAIKAGAIKRADEVATAAFALHMEKNKSRPGTDGGTQPPIEPENVVEIKTDEKGD